MTDVLMAGIGGAGMNMVARLERHIACTTLAINTDSASLIHSSLHRTLLIRAAGSPVPSGAIVGARHAAQKQRPQLHSAVCGFHHVILAAGLGGAAGTGVLPLAAELATDVARRVLLLLVLPFAFESSRRESALEALAHLRNSDADLIVLDNALDAHDECVEPGSLGQFFAWQAERAAQRLQWWLASGVRS